MKGIAVFDIGKTNKKMLLFDEKLNVVFQEEQKMEPIVDDDGFECDDIRLIENWVKESLTKAIESSGFDIVAVNFSTYGASLIFLDEQGNPLTPLYNYLKPVNEEISKNLFDRYGGEEEFCRQTASPSLGLLLNSGIQILWMKKEHPEVYNKVASVLHFPQYLSYLFSRKVVSESTSIGCHTFMWDFDHNRYHQWLSDEGIKLPEPMPNTQLIDIEIGEKSLKTGIGIHDSSASLAPYLLGTSDKFVLLSTGTWCISMNPFNDEILTTEELKQDCLNYINIYQKPVKSARYFMGHIHDVNVERIMDHFGVDKSAYKTMKTNTELMKQHLLSGSKIFFKNGTPEGYLDDTADLAQFNDFESAYHQFMFDLSDECINSLQLVIPANDDVESLIISGGFARNGIFMTYLASKFPNKKVYTSEIDNASALGAAMVCAEQLFETEEDIDLALEQWFAV